MLTITSATEDAQEGVRAFFEKREPVWSESRRGGKEKLTEKREVLDNGK
jgi:hypothetical protein